MEPRFKVNFRIDNIEFRCLNDDMYEFVKWIPNISSERGEYCIVIASMDVSRRDDGDPNLRWCGRRPLELEPLEKDIFDEIVRLSYDIISADIRLIDSALTKDPDGDF